MGKNEKRSWEEGRGVKSAESLAKMKLTGRGGKGGGGGVAQDKQGERGVGLCPKKGEEETWGENNFLYH